MSSKVLTVIERVWPNGKPIQRSVEVFIDTSRIGKENVLRFFSGDQYAYNMLVREGYYTDHHSVINIHQAVVRKKDYLVFVSVYVALKSDL